MTDYKKMPASGPVKPSKKMKPIPAKKKKMATGKDALPGYKVPKKLLKNTLANRAAGGDVNAMFKLQSKEMWEQINKPKKRTAPKAKPKTTKPSSDYAKGEAFIDSQYGGLNEAIDIIQGKNRQLKR